jgi:hypothetical protein
MELRLGSSSMAFENNFHKIEFVGKKGYLGHLKSKYFALHRENSLDRSSFEKM